MGAQRLIEYWQLIGLGAIAGFTIFLGLPLALLQNVSHRKRGFLNAFAIGILIFLVIDVFSHSWESTSGVASSAFVGKGSTVNAILAMAAMFGGLAIGLLGLVWYETRYMSKSVRQLSPSIDHSLAGGVDQLQNQQHQQLFHQANAYKLAMMIAIGIGAHNFSEGLAIGQSYVSGAVGLAIMLVIGFGTHNTTEGFGIAGPLAGLAKKPTVRFLILAGLIGGGPTFIGTIAGSLWSSTVVYILFLSIAGGALIYVSMLMYNSGRKQTTNAVMMSGIFVGLIAGFATDLIVALGGA